MRADRIGVIDEGRLVEVGSHADLLSAGGATPRCSPPGASVNRRPLRRRLRFCESIPPVVNSACRPPVTHVVLYTIDIGKR